MANVWVYKLLAIVLLLSPIILPILFWRGRRSAKTQAPREDGATVEFFVTSSMRLLVTLVLAALVTFTVLVGLYVRGEHGSVYASLIPLTVLLLILLVRPVPVVVDHSGIRQGRWFLPDKKVRWQDIVSVSRGRNTGTTYVVSRNGGPKIRFSVFLVGRARFRHEIRAHAPNVGIDPEEDD